MLPADRRVCRVSDWWFCRAGAVESSSAVVAGEVVPNRRRTHRDYIILWDTVGGTAHTTGHARGYRGGGTPSAYTRGDTCVCLYTYAYGDDSLNVAPHVQRNALGKALRTLGLGPPSGVSIGRLSGVGALWDCVSRVCGGGGGCAGGGVPLGAGPCCPDVGRCFSLGGKHHHHHR